MVATVSSEAAFSRYQIVRDRFPRFSKFESDNVEPVRAGSLVEMSEDYDVFVFDAFGVLNVGNQPIRGAAERVAMLRKAGKKLFVLTNAASYAFEQVVEKFQSLGFCFRDEELISSRAVCEKFLPTFGMTTQWGVIAPNYFIPEELGIKTVTLEDDPRSYGMVDAFLFLSTECWTPQRQALLVDTLNERARPVVVANPDLVAPREEGLTLEPGYYAHDLMDQLPGLTIDFHGKPFPSVYEHIDQLLGGCIDPSRVAMIGDSLHTDIWGARAHGWGAVLVTEHGFLKGQDVSAAINESGIIPDWIVPSI